MNDYDFVFAKGGADAVEIIASAGEVPGKQL
jgi:hypothetical protein